MARFAQTPVPADAVLLVGSSSIRLWPDPAGDLAPYPAVARGFGGAHLADVWTQQDRLFPETAPAALVLYAGENDLAAGRPAAAVAGEMGRLLDRLSARWPAVPILLLGVKPSPARAHLADVFAAADSAFAALARDRPAVAMVPLAPLFREGGVLRPSDYAPDGLHLSETGYARFRSVVLDWLAATVARP